MNEQWESFKTEVDDVKELNYKVTVRAVVTRSQEQPDWLAKYSVKEMQAFLKEDQDLKYLHQWKNTRKRMCASLSPATRRYWLNWENIELIDGIVYQKWINAKSKLNHLQLIVPQILKKDILVLSHNTPYSGHMGVKKTIEKMKTVFTWYKMSQDITEHIQNCTICNKIKGTGKKPKAPLMDYRVGYPLDRIGIAIIGPLTLTKKKNKFILAIGDNFTRWMEAYPIPHQDADLVAQKLVMEFIARFGIPLELHTYQGKNFESDLFKSVCNLFQINKTRTTAYHPSSNGLIERFNKTLGGMIKTFVNKNVTNWDEYINLLLAAYRSTPHPATGFSPNNMMLGREVNIPLNLMFRSHERRTENNEDYISTIKSHFQNVYEIAR
ncbi:protein NYNRIN-like [Mytilus trossulus]|uniref:protein NYNRIN-like n=1 Tax=Mytilus trossulus TaxID=6551 RepID=UPI003004B148